MSLRRRQSRDSLMRWNDGLVRWQQGIAAGGVNGNKNDSNVDRSGRSPRPDLQKFLRRRSSQHYFCVAFWNESSRLWLSIHPAWMPGCENRAMDTGDPAATSARLFFPYAGPKKRKFLHSTREKEAAEWSKYFPPCAANGTRSSAESGEPVAPVLCSSPPQPGRSRRHAEANPRSAAPDLHFGNAPKAIAVKKRQRTARNQDQTNLAHPPARRPPYSPCAQPKQLAAGK